MKVCELKKKMDERRIGVDALSQALGIDRSTMYRKLAALEKITIKEAKKIVKILGFSNEEAIAIFFG